MFDIVGKRYWYFLLSLLVIVPGVISLLAFGLPLSIDFTGGSVLTLQFQQPVDLKPAEVKALLADHNLPDAMVQTSGQQGLVIRTPHIDQAKKTEIEDALEQRYGALDKGKAQFDSVGPSVGAEVSRNASIAVAAAAVAILAYISFAFRHVPNPVRYGTAAIIAMVHDILVVVGTASIFGWAFGWQVDALFLTALLTVIGFSVHDTIVVFDRIRENMGRHRGEPFEMIVNHSIIQTLDRSINTQLTVLFTLTALLLLGGVTTRHFIATLLIGIISGTYSSIFNAAPILVVWEKGEIGQFFRRLRGQAAPA